MGSNACEKPIGSEHLGALRKIIDRLRDCSVNWALTGSCSFAVQGLPVRPNDIDIQTDRNGAYEIERVFSKDMSERVRFLESGKIRSHFGVMIIDGIRVEIMGDIEKRDCNGEWGESVELNRYKKFVTYEGMEVPVLSLEYEYEAYKALGRLDRAEVLKKWLSRRPK
ncbi:MAG: hypothetical protein JSU69_03885 [Candidatus Zixiibacteriota bacterium]|nr:MAG: hypothetical protein JSU69_03885 [candidate division Zixibacteria bacterium]